MIGVVATDAQRPWVAEFFELFKTPWEFHRPGARCEVLLCATDDIPEHEARLVLVFGSRSLPLDLTLDSKPAETDTARMAQGPDGVVPVYGKCLTFDGGHPLDWTLAGTGKPIAIEGKLYAARVIRVGFDLFGEVEHLLTHGQPEQHATIPTLELHIASLRRLVVESGVFLVEIPPTPQGYSMTACLTHDMDHPGLRFHGLDHTLLGFLKRGTFDSVLNFIRGRLSFGQLLRNWFAALKLPLVFVGVAPDFWRQIGHYLELEQELASTFFVIPKKHDAGRRVNRTNAQRRASAYEAADISDDLRAVQQSGREVGVHGLDAWLNANSGQDEAQRVASATGNPCKGVRMHWLCFDKNSPAVLEAAGYEYDSTLGYNGCVGYRNGTAQVYRPPGAQQLLELPLHMMDTALLYPAYLNLSQPEAAQRIEGMVHQVQQTGGVLTVNWHDRSLAPERQWELPYRQLLNTLRQCRAWCPRAGDAVNWFRRRRAVRWQRAADAENTHAVALVAAEAEPQLPGLFVRLYNLANGSGTLTQPVELPLGPAGQPQTLRRNGHHSLN